MIAETSQFPDHLARPHLLRFFADGWPAFLVPNAFVEDLPNQTTQPVGGRADDLCVSEARNERGDRGDFLTVCGLLHEYGRAA